MADARVEDGGGARRQRFVVPDHAGDGEALAVDGGAGGVAALEQRSGRVLGRLVPAEALDAQLAGFWCALLDDDKALLRRWDWDRGELFASFIGNLALRVGGERLSPILRDKAAA